MMLVNHSCEPNVGMGGNIPLVTMADIPAGQELAIDYALFLGDPTFEMECQCGVAQCRRVIRGTDWTNEELELEFAVGLLAMDALALRLVSGVFDRERLVTGAKAARSCATKEVNERSAGPPTASRHLAEACECGARQDVARDLE